MEKLKKKERESFNKVFQKKKRKKNDSLPQWKHPDEAVDLAYPGTVPLKHPDEEMAVLDDKKVNQPASVASSKKATLPTKAEGKAPRDLIYGKDFWGNVSLIGKGSQHNGEVYLVQGKVKSAVEQAAKEGKMYNGLLNEGKEVMRIPTGKILYEVIDSVNDTKDSKRENGGHANRGDTNATRWDEGPAASGFEDERGGKGAQATLVAFQVDGDIETPKDTSDLAFWWHTHPNTKVNGLNLGISNPS